MDEIRRLPGVIHAEPVFNVPCTFRVSNHTKKGAIMGIPRNGELTFPLDDKGEAIPVPTAGLLMTDRLMEKLGINAGEYVNVDPVKGDRITRKIPVVQKVASMMGLMVYADYRWLNRVMGEQAAVSEVRVLAMQSSWEKRRFLDRIRTMPGLETVSDIGEQKQAIVRQFNGAMRSVAVVMIGFAAVIFFGAILNGTLIDIAERQREMATFRTMGYQEKEVGRLFLRENLVTNVLGTLIGLPMGYGMLYGSITGLATDAYSFPAAVEPTSYIYTVALAVVFVLLSQIVVVRSLRAQNWVEALSLKE